MIVSDSGTATYYEFGRYDPNTVNGVVTNNATDVGNIRELNLSSPIAFDGRTARTRTRSRMRHWVRRTRPSMRMISPTYLRYMEIYRQPKRWQLSPGPQLIWLRSRRSTAFNSCWRLKRLAMTSARELPRYWASAEKAISDRNPRPPGQFGRAARTGRCSDAVRMRAGIIP